MHVEQKNTIENKNSVIIIKSLFRKDFDEKHCVSVRSAVVQNNNCYRKQLY